MDLADPEAERSTLAALYEEGRILGAERARRTLAELALVGDDFTESLHRVFFLVVEGALKKGQALVTSLFPAEAKAFLPILQAQGDVSRAQLGTLAERLRELAARRQVYAAGKRVMEAAKDEAVSVPALHGRFETERRSLSVRGTNWRTHRDALDTARTRIEKIQDGGSSGALLTGYRAMDNLFGGLPPTLCVVVGLPGQAKSGFMAGVLRNAAKRGENTAAFFPEDRKEWISYRHLAHESGLSQFALRNCKLPEGDWNAYGYADAAIREWVGTIYIDDRRGIRPAELLLAARQAYQELGAAVVVVDNMSSIPFARDKRMDLEISDFLDSGRALADEFQRPFVVLAHAKRREGLKVGDIPTLTDCRESSGFENFARFALGVAVKQSLEGQPEVEIGVLKVTNGKGQGSKLTLPFRGKSAMLEDD